MTTKIAIAQRKAAAMERITAAAQAAGIEPPSIGAKMDADSQIAAVLEWTAAALEAAAAQAEPAADAATPAPKAKRGRAQ